jgi:hypothetical protein
MKATPLLSCCLAVAGLWLPACARKPATGPGPVRWDRDTCKLCVMAISDRHNAAQVRGGGPGEEDALHLFDDLGCAVVWLDQQSWKDDPRVEIWVNHHRDGTWLAARSAWYQPNQPTPMDYGLAAQPERGDGSLDFAQAREAIFRKAAERERSMP